MSKSFPQTKILPVQTETGCNEVLVSRQRDDAGDDFVQVLAFHFDVDGNGYAQEACVTMPYILIGPCIRDFSSVSAQDYVDKFEF